MQEKPRQSQTLSQKLVVASIPTDLDSSGDKILQLVDDFPRFL